MEPMDDKQQRTAGELGNQVGNLSNNNDERLDLLFRQYREACPDPEPSVNFMPQLWQRIEARRNAASTGLLRRWAEVCLVATLALTFLLTVFVIPHYQNDPEQAYVDVLAAADSANDVAFFPVAELEPVTR